MDLVTVDPEALPDPDDQIGQDRSPVCVEEPVEGATDGVVREPGDLVGLQAEGAGQEAPNGLLLPVDRLALDEDGAQKNTQGPRRIQGLMDAGSGDVAVEQLGDAEPIQEVVDDGKRPEPLTMDIECRVDRGVQPHSLPPP